MWRKRLKVQGFSSKLKADGSKRKIFWNFFYLIFTYKYKALRLLVKNRFLKNSMRCSGWKRSDLLLGSLHSDLDFKIMSKKGFKNSFFSGHEDLFNWMTYMCNAFSVIKSSFFTFCSKLSKKSTKPYPNFLMIFSKSFWFCPSYRQNIQEKVTKSWNADKNGLGNYLSMNFIYFLLSCNPSWWRVIFWTILDHPDHCV